MSEPRGTPESVGIAADRYAREVARNGTITKSYNLRQALKAEIMALANKEHSNVENDD